MGSGSSPNQKFFMATYDHLPVYKASYELLLEIFKFTRNFQREYKYTIGEKLKNETVDMITHIYRANSARVKTERIQQARESLEVIRLYLRLLKDLNQIGLKRFVDINALIETVSRQLCGWQKAQPHD